MLALAGRASQGLRAHPGWPGCQLVGAQVGALPAAADAEAPEPWASATVSVRSIARLYNALHDPATKDELTTETDTGSGGYRVT